MVIPERFQTDPSVFSIEGFPPQKAGAGQTVLHPALEQARAGAGRLIAQLFFGGGCFCRFSNRARKAGIALPGRA